MTHLHALLRQALADLVRTVLAAQPRLDLLFDFPDHHPGAGQLLSLSLLGNLVGLPASIPSFPAIARQLLADCRLAEPDGPPDLGLRASSLVHVVNNLTVFRAEAAVFFSHVSFSQNQTRKIPASVSSKLF